MRHLTFSIVFVPLLLAGCGRPLTEETLSRPEQTDTGAILRLEDAPNEKMPETTDSLEPDGVQTPIVIVAVTGGVLIGNADVPLLTVYTDYDCDYCRQFSIRDLPVLERTYVENNRLAIRLLFFPRSEAGTVMAKAAICAAQLHVFPAADLTFRTGPVAANVTSAVLAKKMGTEQKALASCMADQKTSDELGAVRRQADENGVTRVPHFHVQDEKWLGLKEQDELLRAVDKALSR